MIHVNLHPKRGKRSSGGAGGSGGSAIAGAFAGLGTVAARVRAAVTDKYLAGAVVAVVVGCAAVGYLYTSQRAAEAELVAREDAAARDSSRYASLIAAQTKASARRDSLAGQLRVIAAIDSNRYVWAHLLDEMSQALPQYTWLTAVQQTSAPPQPPGATIDTSTAEGKQKAKAAALADTVSRATRFRLTGHTVDIQALTMFMRDLEASPFVKNVQLASSQAVVTDGKDVTEFTLDAEYQTPLGASGAVRTETITVQVR
jgi:Tfp pilus assembly protein PilN